MSIRWRKNCSKLKGNRWLDISMIMRKIMSIIFGSVGKTTKYVKDCYWLFSLRIWLVFWMLTLVEPLDKHCLCLNNHLKMRKAGSHTFRNLDSSLVEILVKKDLTDLGDYLLGGLLDFQRNLKIVKCYMSFTWCVKK